MSSSIIKFGLLLILFLLHFHGQQAGFFNKFRQKVKAPEKPKNGRGRLSRANAIRRKDFSPIFYHGYDLSEEFPMAVKWNGSPLGKWLPIYHGALAIRGPQWLDGGRQFEVQMYANHGMRLDDNGLRENWDSKEKRMRVQRYLGQSRKRPDEIEAHRQDLMMGRFAKDKYNMFHNNCNHFCKELLGFANEGKKFPSNFNRLAGILGMKKLRKRLNFSGHKN